MPVSHSPLRYPGGKTKLGPYLGSVMCANRLRKAEYAEPYAGGAGAGLHLLFQGIASHLHLNDIDRGVVSFWRAVLQHNERFAKAIESVRLTVPEWDYQKEILRTARMGFDLGFAFFYLNRTNRSGISGGGIIGGREQTGEWKMSARFTREELARRVRALNKYRRNISVTCSDALEFLTDLAPGKGKRAFVYLDPPYFAKGQDLYPNYYDAGDHLAIADGMKRYDLPWLMTYDDCPDIRHLYQGQRVLSSELTYSARRARRGKEVVIFGSAVKPPAALPVAPHRTYRPSFELMVP